MNKNNKIGVPVLHIPMCSGAVVITYNLPGLNDTLNLTPTLIANIFLGKIKNWNDAQIASANPGVKLPNTPIIVAHRSDGSGTTNIFTTYLTQVSPDWNTKVGKGSAVNWPAGLGGKGNEGVAGLVKQTPGGIGYVELAYAMQNKMAFAKVQNKAGKFITPTVQSTSAAGNIQMPATVKVSLLTQMRLMVIQSVVSHGHLFIKIRIIMIVQRTGQQNWLNYYGGIFMTARNIAKV